MNLPLLAAAGAAAAVLVTSLWSFGRGAFPGTTDPRYGTIPLDAARKLPSCSFCHGPNNALNLVVYVDVPQFSLDLDQAISLTTRSTGGLQVPGKTTWGGFLNEVTAGAFTAGATSQIDPTARFITHTFAFNGNRNWTYGYTAPSTPGPIELYAIVNTVDGNGMPAGDIWAFYTGDPAVPTVNTPVRLYANAVGVTHSGAGCGGSYRNQPVLGALQSPTVGNAAFTLDLVGAAALAPVGVALGPPQLPAFDLTAIGVNGCLLHVQPLVVVAGVTGAGSSIRGEGAAALPLPIPNDQSLRGSTVDAQVAVLDAANGRLVPITMTNAVRLTVQ